MTLERGTLLNSRYQIVEILGQGGMASIYRAVDENLGVDCAVKENLFTTEEYARQFRREAVILASLRHPNLPRVTDHFVIDGQGQYLVMDYIEGEDLRQRMDRVGVLPDDEVIVLGAAICDALAYLHSRQPMVLHRDVKPGNVKNTSSGQIFLVDFGLAKVVQSGKVTTTGARAMTPGYSPPEQYGTARTDQRSDIYSLGATLYSALTDNLPEDGLARAMGQACLTPLRQYNPRISRRLSMAVEKSLEVRPDDRYQTADEFQKELLNARSASKRRTPVEFSLSSPDTNGGGSALAKGSALPVAIENVAVDPEPAPLSMVVSTPLEEPTPRLAPPLRRSGGRGCWLTAVSFIFLLGIAAGVYFTQPAWLGGTFSLFPAVQPSPTRLKARATRQNAAAVSAASQTPAPSLTSTQALTLTPTQEWTSTQTPPLPTATYTPAPTPLGGGAGQIAFVSDRTGIPQIWLMNVDGTNLTQITDIPEGACQPSWAPDGLRMVIISPCEKHQESYLRSNLYIIHIDGSGLTPLGTVGGGDYDPAWSPDGRYIAFTSLRGDYRPKLYLLDLEKGNEVSLLTDEGSKNMQPAWSRDGKKIAFTTTRRGPQQIWIMNPDGSSAQLFTRSASLRNAYPNWSPNGMQILFTQDEPGKTMPWLSSALVGSEDTRGLRIYPELGVPMREAEYSPDGVWIVMEAWMGGVNHDLFMMGFNGSSLTRLTSERSWEFDPAWRPVQRPVNQ